MAVPLSSEVLFYVYVGMFGAAALACLAGAWQARRISARGVRRGVVGLLLTSSLWAAADLGMLLASGLAAKTAFYAAGLIVGFGTVGAWLWFASAFSGRSLHRSRPLRRTALLVFAVVTLTKLTNSWHGLYFSAEWHALPFRHLRVNHHVLYWGTTALSYMLAAVGFFMLYEPLRRVQEGSGRVVGLLGLTVLPLVANGLGDFNPQLLDINHEPVGVAAFAIAALFVYREQFEEIGEAGRRTKPTLILSDEGRLRNYNAPAAALFPALETDGAIGTVLPALLPEAAEALGQTPTAAGNAELLQVDGDHAARYYRPTTSTFGKGVGRRVVLTDVTEQVLRRRAQAREHRFLGEAVEQAREAVLVTDAEANGAPDRQIVYANAAFEEMTGYSEEEVLGKTPRVLQGPETDRAVLDALRTALEERASWQGETVNYRKDGTPYIVQWNIAPVTGDEGAVQHWVSVQRDVTEQREREERLRLLAQALDDVDDTVVIADREGLIQYVNDAFERETGYAEDEVLGKRPRVVQSDDHGEAFYKEMWETLRAGETFRGDVTTVRKDGTQYVEEVQVAPVADEEGEISHFVSTGRDVTEERRRKAALRRQKTLLAQAQRLAGAWEVYPQANDASWSDKVYEIFEVEPGTDLSIEEAIQFFPPEARPHIRDAVETPVQEEEPYDRELPIVTAEGNRRWVRTVGAPAEREDGAVTKVAGAFQDITERKEAEEQLRRSRERYRSLFRDSTDAILVHDLDGRIQEANAQAESLFGRDAGGLEGVLIHDLHVSDEVETARNKLQALRDGTEYHAVSRYEHADGSAFWGEVSAGTTGIAGETVVRSLIQDVTEREESRRRLERQKAYTDRLVEAIDDIFFALDETAHFQRWNGRVPEVTGYSDEEIAEMDAFDLVPEDEHERLASTIADGLMTGGERIELPLLHKDGTTTPYEFVGSLVDHPNGDLQIVGIARDIEKRKRREQLLEQAETFFQNAQDALFLIDVEEEDDPTFAVQRVNPAYERQTGLRAEDIYGHEPRELLGEEAARRTEAMYGRCVEQREPVEYEDTLALDDTTMHWQTRIAPVVVEGTVKKIVGSTRDVTDRVRRRQELKAAKEEAEEADRIKTALLSNMNHELRTPLTSVITFARLIRDDPDVAEQFAGRILSGGQRLLYTFNTVVEFAELEGDGLSTTPAPLRLRDVVQSVVNTFRNRIDGENVPLEVDATEESTSVRLDEHLVERILTHLVHNAVKFTEEGAVTVSVRTGTDCAELAVEDPGIGIEPEAHSRVFEEFYQISSGYDRAYEGNGIGLTVAQRMVEKMDGEIDIESTPGDGTTVTVSFPMD